MGRTATKSESSKRDAKTKLAEHRLSVLELARELGNVAEACRQRGLDRTSFYEWKRRFQTQGFEGLKDLPPIHKSHPQTTPPETVERIKELALKHPAYGCNRLEAMLALEGRRVSSITIQKILNDNGLGARHDRWLALEQANADKRLELSAEQTAFLEKRNPCFRERQVESAAPGDLLSADTFFIGTLKGVGKVYLHAVVDTYGSYAFGFLRVSKQPEAAVAVLHNDVLPFYRERGLAVKPSSPTTGASSAVPTDTPTSSTWTSTASSIVAPRYERPRPTASPSDSTAPCSRSSSASRCGRTSTRASRRCRPTSTPGCSTTTPYAPISGIETRDGGPSKPSTSS